MVGILPLVAPSWLETWPRADSYEGCLHCGSQPRREESARDYRRRREGGALTGDPFLTFKTRQGLEQGQEDSARPEPFI